MADKTDKFIPPRFLRVYDLEMFKYILTHGMDIRLERVLKTNKIKYYYFRMLDYGSNTNRTIEIEEKKVIVNNKIHRPGSDEGIHTNICIKHTYNITGTESDDEIRENIIDMVDATIERIKDLVINYGFLFSYNNDLMLTLSQYYGD